LAVQKQLSSTDQEQALANNVYSSSDDSDYYIEDEKEGEEKLEESKSVAIKSSERI